jgi:hypothetical protein
MPGHADSRMVERIYGRMPEENLRAVLTEHVEPYCAQPATKVAKGRRERRLRTSKSQGSSRFLVSRDGIEPPTRGFSILTTDSRNTDQAGNMPDHAFGLERREPGKGTSTTHWGDGGGDPIAASLGRALDAAVGAGQWELVSKLADQIRERERSTLTTTTLTPSNTTRGQA